MAEIPWALWARCSAEPAQLDALPAGRRFHKDGDLKPPLAVRIRGALFFDGQHRRTTRKRDVHPNILPLFDSGRVGGTVFYVMPYVQGASLDGERFLMIKLPPERMRPRINVVLNWFDELRTKVPR